MKRDVHGRRIGLPRSWWSPARAAIALLAFVVVAGCGELLPPLPTEQSRFDLIANVPVAGAQLELARDPGVTLVSVEALRSGVLVRAVSRGDRVYLAWVADSPAAGAQVRVTIARSVVAEDPPAIVAVESYAAGDGTDLGAASLRWRVAGDGDAVADSELTAVGVSASGGTLRAWFADHPLGDVGRSGTVNVQDALKLLDLLRVGGWDDYQRYHGDIDGDGVVDLADLEVLLDKIVDPELPAVLHVKPAELSFLQLSGGTQDPGVVLIANRGRRPFPDLDWFLPDGISATVAGAIPDQSLALELTVPGAERLGWRPGFLEVSGAGDQAFVRLGHLVFLVAGQSNASGRGLPLTGWADVPSARVRMLGNDYAWNDAVEPLDSTAGQVDDVSQEDDGTNPRFVPGYSFGTRLGHLLADATGFGSYLIPAALGGSRVTLLPADPESWLPGAPLDRNTLFGSAVFRARVSAGLETGDPGIAQAFPPEGGPPTAVLWYQGESDANSATSRLGFVDGTVTVVNAFRTQLSVPVVYVQLASHENPTTNEQQLFIAERQRRLETGSGYAEASRVSDHHMVVAFDLPRWDNIHLNAYGQRLLAERLDLAIREHVLGEDVDGTGPRLEGIVWNDATRVTLLTTQVLQAGPIDKAYVTVFDGRPNGVVSESSDPPTGTNVITVDSVVRDPDDPTRVRITLASTPTSPDGPHVLYMAPPGIAGSLESTVKRDLVRAAAGIGEADLGLPLPAFGALAPF